MSYTRIHGSRCFNTVLYISTWAIKFTACSTNVRVFHKILWNFIMLPSSRQGKLLVFFFSLSCLLFYLLCILHLQKFQTRCLILNLCLSYYNRKKQLSWRTENVCLIYKELENVFQKRNTCMAEWFAQLQTLIL